MPNSSENSASRSAEFSPASGWREVAFISRKDLMRALILVLLAGGIGVGLNFVRRPPLEWSYRTKAERLAEETGALADLAPRNSADAGFGGGAGAAAFPRTSLEELRTLMAERRGVVIDARPALFFRAGHLPGSENLPREGFQAAYGRIRAVLEKSRDQPVVVYCGGGSCEDSDLIAGALRSLGFTRVSVFAGGWREWLAAGLPAETGGGAVP